MLRTDGVPATCLRTERSWMNLAAPVDVAEVLPKLANASSLLRIEMASAMAAS